MVVGEILCNTVEAILNKLCSLALEEIQLSLSFKDELERFHSTLSTISAVLLDAEQWQHQSHAVRDWLRKLKDTLNDAQDLLDDLTAEALSQKVEPRWAIVTQVCNYFFCSEMGRRVMNIRERLDAIAEERRQFHFKEQVDSVQPISRRENTYSFVRDTRIVGRENDKRAVIKLLFDNGNENLSVVPVVGMGGLGKTALTKLVFNDNGIKGHFHLRVWVSVSDDLNAKRIVEKIITAATGTNLDHLDIENMHIRLLEMLNEKKFLLVLDDVWNGNHAEWIELKDLLGNGTKGSKIVVTTRNKNTASIMGSGIFYNLAGLPHDDCWSLFEKWAFREGESARHPRLAEIGQEIVRKCGGVPLAIRTVGSLLYLNTTESSWLYVASESWDIAQGEGDILPVLKLSYDQLPPHLKECFAYCSLLPKGQEFDKETLIQLWMAQGFIHSSNRYQQLEDVGGLYFDELVLRSFFDVVRENNKGEIVKCRIHDLLHDLAISVKGTECFTPDSHTTTMFENVRHLSFRGLYFEQDTRPLLKAKKLRTLLLPAKMGNSSENFLGALISSSTYLRVLDLSYSGIKNLPSYIGGMKHLRYLNLNGNHHLECLPDSICKLHSLQTLNLLGCTRINAFPRKFGNLISLRHLIINSPLMHTRDMQLGSLTSLQSLAIVHCHNLISLSEVMRHLTALRTLRIHNCSKLTSLLRNVEHNAIENLEIVKCPKLSFLEECMQSFSNLRSLTINGLPQLATLPNKLECCAGTLQYLFITDCISLMTLPECLGNLSSLKRVDIICCLNLLNLPYTFCSLSALQVVRIDQCPLLSTRCQRDVGEDWPKIAHVPQIYVDRKKI